MRVVHDAYDVLAKSSSYPSRGYQFIRGQEEAFLIWDGYLDELIRATWRLYGFEFDPERPSVLSIDQLPILDAWNTAAGCFGAECTTPFPNVASTARAFRDAFPDVEISDQEMARHLWLLIEFLEEAARSELPVVIESWWG